jgi:hypothetical protein
VNSKGHLYVSLVKSGIRFASCILALLFTDWWFLAYGFAIAEGLGVVEELVDRR